MKEVIFLWAFLHALQKDRNAVTAQPGQGCDGIPAQGKKVFDCTLRAVLG